MTWFLLGFVATVPAIIVGLIVYWFTRREIQQLEGIGKCSDI